HDGRRRLAAREHRVGGLGERLPVGRPVAPHRDVAGVALDHVHRRVGTGGLVVVARRQVDPDRAFAGVTERVRPQQLTGDHLFVDRDLAGAVRPGSALTGQRCLELFDAQLTSRHLDLAARWLRKIGAGFYTIGSSGHEGNAAVAAALRMDDPALLHYRSGAFYQVRAADATPPRDGVRDVLLGLVAAAAEPIAGGRHKVFGRADLHIIPQTST